MTEFPDPHQRRANGVARLFEQLARRVLERRNGDDLHASQWSALRYFSRAGRKAATISGLSRYLGNTTGSTSRSARTLVERGLLDVSKAEHDGRSVTFVLTEEGKARLKNDPLTDFTAVLMDLDEEELRTLARQMDQLATSLAERRR